MNVQQAIQMVITDQREEWGVEDDITDEDLIYELQGGMQLAERGQFSNRVEDDGTELAQAYMLILATDERFDDQKKRQHMLSVNLTTAYDEDDTTRVQLLTELLADVEAELVEIDRVRERNGL